MIAVDHRALSDQSRRDRRSRRAGPAGIQPADRDQDPEDDRLRARRTAGDVDIDRENPVDAAGARVSLADDAPGGRAGSHGDDDARLGYGIDGAKHGSLEVARDRAGDHDPVGVARLTSPEVYRNR